MSTGLREFDRTVRDTNEWLRDMGIYLDVPRRFAYAGLRATLHALRDRLPPETALHFADQLPILLRGVFIEAWSPATRTRGEDSVKAFANRISRQLPPGYPLDAETVARAAFRTVYDHMDGREVDQVLVHLPKHIRELWLEDLEDLEDCV